MAAIESGVTKGHKPDLSANNLLRVWDGDNLGSRLIMAYRDDDDTSRRP